MKNSSLRFVAITAIFATLIILFTAYICHIPMPGGGYLHFGDSLLYLSATILPAPYAMAAGAIGGGMADLLTAPIYTLPTILIKMLVTIPFTRKTEKIITPRNVVATVLAYCISATGYYFANTLVANQTIAFLTSITSSLVQSAGSAVIFVILGLALDQMNFKKKLMY